MAEQPFTAETFSLAGLRFRLARHDDHLRVLSVAPPGAVLGPDPSAGWLWQRTPALVHVRGGARMGHHGARCVGTQPSVAMKLARLERGGSPANGSLAVELADPDSGLRVVLRYASCGVKGVVSATLEARNDGEQPVTLEQLMLCLPGLGRTDNADWPATTRIHAAKSCWFGEAQWYVARPSDLGIADTRTWNGDVTGAATWRNIGTWTTANDLPMVVLEDRDSGLSWFLQIETSGSWQMEVGRMIQGFYLAAGGPSLRYGDWSVTLAPGESVQAAPVAFGCVVGRFEEAIAALQGYRRKA